MQALAHTDLPGFELLSRGKVRDIYAISNQQLLMVTTDRMSAFDVVLPDPVPGKGVVLNQLTLFWMDLFADLIGNHVLKTKTKDLPAGLRPYSQQLQGRSVLVRRAEPLPIECIVRGYLSGSGWEEYRRSGTICGQGLPPGLRKSELLPEPLFTPSTKAMPGQHDQNISLARARELVGPGVLDQVQSLSLNMYLRARDYAQRKGILIADTKFEFGLIQGQLVLIDEVLTPDSSRFWPRQGYLPGQDQPSFDKQYLRNWLVQSGWDQQSPGPFLPNRVIAKTRDKYLQAYTWLTGKELS